MNNAYNDQHLCQSTKLISKLMLCNIVSCLNSILVDHLLAVVVSSVVFSFSMNILRQKKSKRQKFQNGCCLLLSDELDSFKVAFAVAF